MSHVVAAAIYDGIAAFEYSIAREILGRDRELVEEWYDFLPCRVEPGRMFSNHGLEIRPPGALHDLAKARTVLIPGWREPLDQAPPEPFLDALREAQSNGAHLVSICTGVFPLAHAGLLNGRRATTHWLHAETLKSNFPDVEVLEDALYLHDESPPGAISTSAGSAAGLDLCLAVVRRDFGVKVANTVARRMVAPVHRDGGQSQYVEPNVQTAETDQFGPVLDWMVAHLDQPIVVEEVARRFGFSLRTFQRRFKEQTSLSPHQWVVRQRVAKARELLEATDRSIEQIASLSGLGSAANLRKHLAQHLGTTPRAYRTAFRAVAAARRA